MPERQEIQFDSVKDAKFTFEQLHALAVYLQLVACQLLGQLAQIQLQVHLLTLRVWAPVDGAHLGHNVPLLWNLRYN
jgi:hypothetical protein